MPTVLMMAWLVASHSTEIESPCFGDEESATLSGTVSDVSTGKPIEAVSITVRGPNGFELAVSTDHLGGYRVAGLAPGVYLLLLEREGFRTYNRGGIAVRSCQPKRVSVELLPVARDEPTIECRGPVIDTGSARTGIDVSPGTFSRVPLFAP